MNNDWIDILRRKLDSHSETPPADLWSDINAALPPESPRQPRAPRWLYAAACALLLFGIAWLFGIGGEEKAAAPMAASEAAALRQPLSAAQESDGALIAMKKPAKTAPTANAAATADALPQPEAENADYGQEDSLPTEAPQPSLRHEQNDAPGSKQTATSPASPEKALYAYEKPTKRRTKRLALNLFASNLPTSSSTTGSQDFMYSDPTNPGDNNSGGNNSGDNLDNNSGNDNSGSGGDENNGASATRGCAAASSPQTRAASDERSVKHQQPLRLGFSLSYPLTERLSLNGGLMFVRLSSTVSPIGFSSLQGSEKKTQVNIALPIGATFQLLRVEPLSLYLTAGGSVEKCVSGEERRAQFSIFGGGGLQLQLADGIAVYAEPLVSHFPQNNSSAVNIYKDKPTAFDFRLGLRFNLAK